VYTIFFVMNFMKNVFLITGIIFSGITTSFVLFGVEKSIAALPPGTDIVLGVIAEYAKTNIASGGCIAQANGGTGSNSVDNDNISNFSSFFGESDIDLHCEHHNEKASAYDDIVWTVPSGNRDAAFKKKSYDAIALPPDPGQKNPQTAYAAWQIFYKGQLVAGAGAPGAPGNDPKWKEATLQELLQPAPRLPINSLNLSDEFIVNLPSDLDLTTILYAPNWDYWVPLFSNGITNLDTAWNYVTDSLQGQGIAYSIVDISAEMADNRSASASVPEPSSTLSLLALGTLGAASTLKRKLKPSKSPEKETTKVG
jgi:hypothetical protein